MTFREYLDKYEKEIDVLEIYDRNGVELPGGYEIPDDVQVLYQSRLSGIFSCGLDLDISTCTHGGKSMKYCVTIERTGCLYVEASSEDEARDIAQNQYTDTVSWSDDWLATYVEEDESNDEDYITEKWQTGFVGAQRG